MGVAIISSPIDQQLDEKETALRESRILILEADAAIQRLLRAVLRHQGLQAVIVRDGKDAIGRLDPNSVAAFIIDVSLAPSALEPGARGGLGYLHYLQRKDPQLLDRVVVLSGLTPRDFPADFPSVARFLRKPFDINELLSAVNKCVERS